MCEICEEAWKYVKATNAIEGLYLTPEQEALIRKVLKGEITEEEFHKQALEIAKHK
ncbi:MULTISPECIES: antitoxin VbhA family protein [Aeribacillus]|uniref:antitoxin VbhA family protein n=1 Tax=Aeribacillus TaxID=1055323 RepID=UPI0012FD8BA1|nr:antitoxin VbhA family protein [Aeribacillus pallidus]